MLVQERVWLRSSVSVGWVKSERQRARTQQLLYYIDQYKLHLPILGEIYECIALAQFSLAFNLALSAGVVLTDGILLDSRSSNNRYLQYKIANMSGAI